MQVAKLKVCKSGDQVVFHSSRLFLMKAPQGNEHKSRHYIIKSICSDLDNFYPSFQTLSRSEWIKCFPYVDCKKRSPTGEI